MSKAADSIFEAKKGYFYPWHREFLNQFVDLKNSGRLPHAILINSQDKSDLTEFLWYLATLLLCENNANHEICQSCQPCLKMEANSYSNFKLVEKLFDEKKKKYNKNINIQQIREVIYSLGLSRNHDNLNIVSIYPAEKMSNEAANSLLKTLEEPNEHSVLILVSHNLGKIPITIRSRCQIWNLDLPDTEQSISWLNQQMGGKESASYLELADKNPIFAVELKEINYLDVVDEFKTDFLKFLRNELDVATLAKKLGKHPLPILRQLIQRIIRGYSYRLVGMDLEGNPLSLEINKQAASRMFELNTQVTRQLSIDENNLDLQLQLEDVLISIKQNLSLRDE